MSAAQRWREQLEAWAIPQELLDGVPWNPYEWPADLFARRDSMVADGHIPERYTRQVIRRFRPGSLIDVGAGAGGSCLDLAAEGISVTAVERDAGMAAKLQAVAAERGLSVVVVEGGWPESAGLVGRVDIAACSHVIHNVPDLVPFLTAMQSVARSAVVIQEFENHPWAHLGPYYRKLHNLDRPTGPTVDDLVAVIEESLKVTPTVERWNGGAPMSFVDRDELLTFYGRRLVVPLARWAELEAVLDPEIVELEGGRVQLEDRQKSLATVWWQV